MLYNIDEFVATLRTRMYEVFPHLYGRGLNPSGSFKHGRFNEEIRDVAFMNNSVQVLSDDMQVFDIGNDYAERFYPYYHILEDAPVIHKRGKGTAASKGSQATIEKLSKRDYGLVGWSGKSFTKEYEKNVRGKRASVINNSQQVVDGKIINKESSTYKNIHYKYIETMLEKVNPIVAQEYDLRLLRTQSTGLVDEYLSETEEEPVGYDEITQMISNVLGMWGTYGKSIWDWFY